VNVKVSDERLLNFELGIVQGLVPVIVNPGSVALVSNEKIAPPHPSPWCFSNKVPLKLRSRFGPSTHGEPLVGLQAVSA